MEKTIITSKIENKTITLKQDEKLLYVVLADKGWENRPTLKFHLKGKNAEILFVMLITGRGDNKFYFDTEVVHESRETKSDLVVKSVLFGRSALDYSGKIIINQNAQLANAYLANHNLLFSDEAKVRSIPALEIMADDVKAGHAATMGKPDKEMLFYLMSRGLDKSGAEKLLIEGFFRDVLKKVPEVKTGEAIMDFIIKTLNLPRLF